MVEIGAELQVPFIALCMNITVFGKKVGGRELQVNKTVIKTILGSWKLKSFSWLMYYITIGNH